MSFKTIMSSIGNVFKTGWNNGKIQKGLQLTGLATFGVGMTGAMVHNSKNSRNCNCSIFSNTSNHSLYCNNHLMFNMYNNPMAMFSNMNMLNINPSGINTNPYLTMQGQHEAYMWGANMRQKFEYEKLLAQQNDQNEETPAQQPAANPDEKAKE